MNGILDKLTRTLGSEYRDLNTEANGTVTFIYFENNSFKIKIKLAKDRSHYDIQSSETVPYLVFIKR